MSGPDPLERLPRALHPLAEPPGAEPWNLRELDGLLPAGARLRQAAVLVPLIERARGLQVLLTRRTEALRLHAGQVSFPGGRIEPDDRDPVSAALREASEEVGLGPDLSRPQGYLDPFATITGFHVYPVVARVDDAFHARPDPGEVAEAFEVPLSHFLDPANHEQHSIVHEGRVRQFHAMPYQGYFIWGATAGIIMSLYRVLRG